MSGGVHPVDGRCEVRLVPELRDVREPASIAGLHIGLIITPERFPPFGYNHCGEYIDQIVPRAVYGDVIVQSLAHATLQHREHWQAFAVSLGG